MKSKHRQVYDEYLQFSQQAKNQEGVVIDGSVPVMEEQCESEYAEVYDDYNNPLDNVFMEQTAVMGQRAKYSAQIDRFLNNGIIITGVLLLVVLAIAFLI